MLIDYLIPIKVLFKIISLFIILFLFIVTVVFTYKAQIEVWDFFKVHDIQSRRDLKILTFTIPVLIGMATVIQSAPVIWNKLSYWGQLINNFIIKTFTGRQYFIYEIKKSLSQIRETINKINIELHPILLDLINKEKDKIIQPIEYRVNKLVNQDMILLIKHYKKTIQFLKNNSPTDAINKHQKESCESDLNNMLVEISEILLRIAVVKKILLIEDAR